MILKVQRSKRMKSIPEKFENVMKALATCSILVAATYGVWSLNAIPVMS